jgi:formylglycine-generating enzyme required for sulfatase activity
MSHSRTWTTSIATVVFVAALSTPGDAESQRPLHSTRMVTIPAGSYLPLYAERGAVSVKSFKLDITPVTQAQFAAYASGSGARVAPGAATRPATNVTRSAARAYCTAVGKRLPTVHEWELAAAASATARNGTADPAFRQYLIELYTRMRAPGRVLAGFVNVYGVRDLHGLVWEWTEESHAHAEHGTQKHDMSCAGSAQGASTTADFAAFLRYAFRSGLKESSSVDNLGFRCAESV